MNKIGFLQLTIKIKFTIFIITSLFLSIKVNCQKSLIENYQLYFAYTKIDNQEFIVIRKFIKNKNEYFLMINPKNLESSIISEKNCTAIKSNFSEIKNKFSETKYLRLLDESKANAMLLQDAGITHSLPTEAGINLTIDLCPSNHPLNKNIFIALLKAFKNIEKPIPLAIAVSGYWINNHKNELNWIKELQSENEIDICWINHSLTHHYNKSKPLNNNFMLMKKTNVTFEILGNEKKMIENDLLPSVFFRFPGLISNEALIDTVYNYGLITVGSDAWLAKGNKANAGSIVLIHGNGNETIGVSEFLKLLISKKKEEHNKSWLLFDLRKSLN